MAETPWLLNVFVATQTQNQNILQSTETVSCPKEMQAEMIYFKSCVLNCFDKETAQRKEFPWWKGCGVLAQPDC